MERPRVGLGHIPHTRSQSKNRLYVMGSAAVRTSVTLTAPRNTLLEGGLIPLSKLQILVIHKADDSYVVQCNQDNFSETHETLILAMIAGADHKTNFHPNADKKFWKRRKSSAGKHRKDD